MARYNIEYKVVINTDNGVETTYAKKVVDDIGLTNAIQWMSNNGSLDFFTVRLIKETKPKVGDKVKVKDGKVTEVK